MDDKCTALAIRVEDQDWYKEIMALGKFCAELNKIAEVIQTTVKAFAEAFENFAKTISPTLQESMDALSNIWNEYMEEMSEVQLEECQDKKQKFNSNNKNNWNNCYKKRMIKDKRSDLKHFTMYRK